jgi:hypothetical protein
MRIDDRIDFVFIMNSCRVREKGSNSVRDAELGKK